MLQLHARAQISVVVYAFTYPACTALITDACIFCTLAQTSMVVNAFKYPIRQELITDALVLRTRGRRSAWSCTPSSTRPARRSRSA